MSLAALVTLSAAVVRHLAPFALDRHLESWAVHHRSGLVVVSKVVTTFGTWPVLGPLAVVLLAILLPRRGAGRAIGLAVGVGAVALARRALVSAIARPRPPRRDWASVASGASFPSGHTTAASVVAGATVLALWPYLSPRARAGASIAAVLLAFLVGCSRVLLAVHWATDVLGGWLLGLTYVCGVLALAAFPRARLSRGGA